jgi:hypothetical protein
VGSTLGDPYRNGNVAQADARVMSHTYKDVGVVRQKVPAGDWCLRILLHISRRVIHESMIHCGF